MLVAVKMIHLGKAQRKGVQELKVKKEAQILSKLSHPNIVRYQSSFEWQGPGNAKYFCLVMEYVDGGGLDEKIGEAIPEETVIRWGTEILAALAHMHGQTVMHRDLKPENVLLTSATQAAKVADLGLASVMESKATTGRGSSSRR